jgi:hypothetical protein
MHISAHIFCLILSLVLAILAAANVPSRYVGLFPASFAAYLLALFFT